MALFRFGKRTSMVAVLDITSGGVRGGFVMLEREKPPLVVATVERTFIERGDASPERMRTELPSLVRDVIEQLHRDMRARPSEVRVFFSAPWSESDMRTIRYESPAEFTFTERLASRMVTSELGQLMAGGGRTIVDQRVISVTLNGYPAEQPHGKRCRTATLECLFSFAPEALVDEVADAIHATWKTRIVWGSGLISDYVALRDTLAHSGELLVIAPGAEVTEVLMMRPGHHSGTALVPFGTSTFKRRAGELLRMSTPEMNSLFGLWRGRSLSDEAGQSAAEAFDAALSEWQTGLKSVLQGLSPKRHIPHTIMFAGADPVTEYFKGEQTPVRFPEFTSGQGGFNAILSDMKTVHDHVRFAPGAIRDPRIAMKAIYLSR